MTITLNIGGLVAAGFDLSGEYLLTVSHSGRGVFSTKTWKRIARDSTPTYPVSGQVLGIGPLSGIPIDVIEKDFKKEALNLMSPDGLVELSYESGTVTISETATRASRGQ